MSWFGGWDEPLVVERGGTEWFPHLSELAQARVAADIHLSEWAARIDQDWLDHDQVWYSGISKRDISRLRTMLVLHLFNHEIHHRGQVHAMLTAAGEDTDI